MSKFVHGDFVKHRASDIHVFQVVLEMESVPPGLPSLYRCMSLDNERRLYNYHEDEIYSVMLTDDEAKQIAENAALSEPPLRLADARLRIDPIFTTRDFQARRDTCFLVMPFSADWSGRVHQHIAKTLKRLGYRTIRADDLYGHDVLEDIWRAINECQLVVADTTGKNPNVFYEIGIAHTLGKRVILISQDSNDIPFDFRRYRHILYRDNTDGFELLTRQLPGYIQ